MVPYDFKGAAMPVYAMWCASILILGSWHGSFDTLLTLIPSNTNACTSIITITYTCIQLWFSKRHTISILCVPYSILYQRL